MSDEKFCKQLEMLGSHCRSETRLFVRVGVPVADAKIRNDSGGKGHYGAGRGDRSHKGIDIATKVDQEVVSPIDGTISKIGWANKTHRYVEIEGKITLKDLSGNLYEGEECRIRVMYVKPSVKEGISIRKGKKIGVADDLHRNNQYPKNVGQHIHVEVRLGTATINPDMIVPVST